MIVLLILQTLKHSRQQRAHARARTKVFTMNHWLSAGPDLPIPPPCASLFSPTPLQCLPLLCILLSWRYCLLLSVLHLHHTCLALITPYSSRSQGVSVHVSVLSLCLGWNQGCADFGSAQCTAAWQMLQLVLPTFHVDVSVFCLWSLLQQTFVWPFMLSSSTEWLHPARRFHPRGLQHVSQQYLPSIRAGSHFFWSVRTNVPFYCGFLLGSNRPFHLPSQNSSVGSSSTVIYRWEVMC